VHCVGIGELKDFAAGKLGTGGAGPRLSEPPVGSEFLTMRARVASRPFARRRRCRRSMNRRRRSAPAADNGRQNRCDAALDVVRFVARGDNDGDERRPPERRVTPDRRAER
jgi:hypothetical protein